MARNQCGQQSAGWTIGLLMTMSLQVSVLCGVGCSGTGSALPQFRSVSSEGPPPSAQQIFARHLEAVGGAKAWESKRSAVYTGTVDLLWANSQATMRLVSVEPDRVRYESELPGSGVLVHAFDGSVGWIEDPSRGTLVMSSLQIGEIRRDGRFLVDLDLTKDPGPVELLGLFEFDGKPCWRVKLEGIAGVPVHRFYCSKTGLFAGYVTTTPALGGPDAVVVMTVNEYQQFDDVQVAAKATHQTAGRVTVSRVSAIQWNSATVADVRPPRKPAGATPSNEAETSTGTCFAVRPDGWLVTASHVVDGAERVEVHFGSAAVPARVIATDRKSDVALIRVDVPTPECVPLARDSNIQLGRRVYTLGYPAVGFLSQDVRFTEGTISSVRAFEDRDDLFQISVPVQPGNSGGALIDETGFVIGVVVGKASVGTFLREVGSLPENISFAVDIDRVLPLLTTAGVEAVVGPPANPSVAAKATHFVVSRHAAETKSLQDMPVAQHGNYPGRPISDSIVQLPTGLSYVDVSVGTGAKPSGRGGKVLVHYTGYFTDGRKFDSSVDRGSPVWIPLDKVIRGWAQGIGSMRAGGVRKLIVPPDLGYGDEGRPPVIPQRAVLIFDVELIAVDR